MYKLKSGIKKGAKVTLKISPNVVGNSNDENNLHINHYQLIHIPQLL